MKVYPKLISLLLLLTSTISLFSQKAPAKFGKISMDEMKMLVYDKDTAAEAVALVKYGISELEYSTSKGYFEILFNTHVRIKILKKEGLDNADIEIRLYNSNKGAKETLGGLKAVTYNLKNGKIVETKIPKKDIFTEKESDYWTIKKFALPNVKVGSVIEYKYSMRSPFMFNFQSWYFQSDIPIAWSEYRTKIPEYYDYREVFGGYLDPSISESETHSGSIQGTSYTYSKKVKRWVYQDVPAFKNEKFISTPKDYLEKVEFELVSENFPGSGYQSYSSTWDAVVTDLMQASYFGSALNRKGIVKELAAKINPADNGTKKIVNAYYLIKNHMKWNGKYSKYIKNTLKSAYNENKGNSAEINLLLINLLRAVGIQAEPVLISTRSYGKVNIIYPRVASFNSVIVMAKADGKTVLLDATTPYLTPGELPHQCLNGSGLVATQPKSYWTPLRTKEKYDVSTMIMAKINDGQFSAQIGRSFKSISALNKRNQIASETEEKYIENKKKKNSDWEISEYKIENATDVTKTLKERIKVNNFNNIDTEADIIYIPALISDEIEENPFSSETRRYPVDFGAPISKKTMFTLAIPEGYTVDELPKTAQVALPNKAAKFVYQAQQVGTNIQVMSILQINKALFQPHEYHLLRELYRNVIEKYGEQIVLKSIEE